jgi:hypothetical protein
MHVEHRVLGFVAAAAAAVVVVVVFVVVITFLLLAVDRYCSNVLKVLNMSMLTTRETKSLKRT